jgi:hypothetical protein
MSGMSRKRRSPEEEKALSYARDCRNAYGENDKASRKLIPLRKAQESRKVRRNVTQELTALPAAGDEAADLIESSARQDVQRVGGWRKARDAPLGELVAGGLRARESRVGRKARSRLVQEQFITALEPSKSPAE